jgi:hypothetical protein
MSHLTFTLNAMTGKLSSGLTLCDFKQAAASAGGKSIEFKD